MTFVVKFYTDEDMSALIATLLRSRGMDITTVPEQATLGKTDIEQLEILIALNRCFLTHNRVDFERLHLQLLQENRFHSGIIIVPQKNAYEVAQRIGILASKLTKNEIDNQLLYA
jgi:predicted nuclease of predicted toxin-antitoxin system